MKFVPSILLPNYGWPHKEAGRKYAAQEMSFRQTINALSRTDRGFGIVVDRLTRRVVISFDSESVGNHHAEWMDSVRRRIGSSELNPQPYWGFDDLFHKAGTKLKNCFYVKAESKKQAGRELFRYSEIMILQEFSLEGFLQAIEKGIILIDFDARTGHNHGTKFRMRQDALPSLYTKVQKV